MNQTDPDAIKPRNQQSDEKPDIWEALKERKKRGLWSGEITTHEIKEYNLSTGKHYFVMEDIRKRSIVCTSCPVKHGGFLEAKMLTRYKLDGGVLYLDDKAINTTD